MRVGTGICLVAQRDPIVTAKAVATLDVLSGGRFVFGVGFGWNEDEAADHGVEMKRRRDIAREHVLAMQALWRDDVASFDGEFVQLPPSWSWPKPVQPGGPPVLIGGARRSEAVRARRGVRRRMDPDRRCRRARRVAGPRRACEARGRDPKTLRIVPFGTVPDAGKIEYYASIGVDEIVLRLPADGPERVVPLLDEYAELVGACERCTSPPSRSRGTPYAWKDAGFSVDADACITVGHVRMQTGVGERGIAAWYLSDEPPDVTPAVHPNGVVLLDHLVVFTDDPARTTASYARVGLDVRRYG